MYSNLRLQFEVQLVDGRHDNKSIALALFVAAFHPNILPKLTAVPAIGSACWLHPLAVFGPIATREATKSACDALTYCDHEQIELMALLPTVRFGWCQWLGSEGPFVLNPPSLLDAVSSSRSRSERESANARIAALHPPSAHTNPSKSSKSCDMSFRTTLSALSALIFATTPSPCFSSLGHQAGSPSVICNVS
jgi:hypothetical protein